MMRCVISLLTTSALRALTCVPQASNAVGLGVPIIATAGNSVPNLDPIDVNNVSPARVSEVITVGATTIDDNFASFSNFGAGVDFLAPGENIPSAGILTDDAVQILSGTSQAA